MLRRVGVNTEIAAPGLAGSKAQAHALILRHPRWSDYEAWAEARRRDSDHLRPWEPEWSDTHLSRAAYRARLNRFRKMVQGDRAYPFHVFRADTDAFVGACNLTHVERGAAHSAKIGYWITRDAQGLGHGRTAVRGLTRFAFGSLGLHRLEAAVQPENAPSIRVLEATRYSYEGQARGLLKIDGVWADHAIYARLVGD